MLQLQRMMVVAAAGVSMVMPGSCHAQALEGWRPIYSTADFDYMALRDSAEELIHPQDSLPVLRITMSRMLARNWTAARAELISARRSVGASVAGYESYASSTEILDIQCADRSVSLRESVDFDDQGTILRQSTYTPEWVDAAALPDSLPKLALVHWACDARTPVAHSQASTQLNSDS